MWLTDGHMFTIRKCIERLWNKYGYSFGIETINTSRHSRVVPNPIVDQTRQSLYLFTDQNGAKTQQFNLGRPTFLYGLDMGFPPPPSPCRRLLPQAKTKFFSSVIGQFDLVLFIIHCTGWKAAEVQQWHFSKNGSGLTLDSSIPRLIEAFITPSSRQLHSSYLVCDYRRRNKEWRPSIYSRKWK